MNQGKFLLVLWNLCSCYIKLLRAIRSLSVLLSPAIVATLAGRGLDDLRHQSAADMRWGKGWNVLAMWLVLGSSELNFRGRIECI